MKFLFFAALLCSFLTAQADESQKLTTITKSQEFSASLTPDRLSTKLYINVIKEDYAQAANTLSSISTAMRRYEKICKNSGYSINKAMEWDATKKKNVFAGYKGSFTLDCEYGRLQEMEQVYNDPFLKRLIRDNQKATVTNRGTQWIVSAKTALAKQEELETEAIKYSDTYAEKLSGLLNKQCKAKNIRLSTIRPKQIVTNKAVLMFESAATDRIQAPNPTKQDTVINYSASYVFTCE